VIVEGRTKNYSKWQLDTTNGKKNNPPYEYENFTCLTIINAWKTIQQGQMVCHSKFIPRDQALQSGSHFD
jgi:hypothetical protein